MLTRDVYEAFSLRSDHALSEALLKLQRQLINKAHTLGPAAVAFQLRDEKTLIQTLNRIEADANNTPAELVAFLTGFIRAYVDYLSLIVDGREIDSANARLSADGDARDQIDSIRMMILKAAYAHPGARAMELVSVVARLAKVNESSVKFHLKKLVDIRLMERLKISPKAVSYRMSPLGEAVLSRRSKPYELALFTIDEAASDADLRAAIKKEIEIVWLGENVKWPAERPREGAQSSVVLCFPTIRVAGPQQMGPKLARLNTQYLRKNKR